jgi:hypothetical protein
MSIRLSQMLNLNPDFARSYRRGERWAVKRAEDIAAMDSRPVARFPARQQNVLGNHCGSCPYKDGCMNCDLPYSSKMKDMVGELDTKDNPGKF